MFLDPYVSSAESLLKAWQSGVGRVRTAIVTAIVAVMGALLAIASATLGLSDIKLVQPTAAILGAAAAILTVGVIAYQGLLDQQAKERKLATVEQNVREHPEKPQLAWDLARTKLENYLDRNLSQVRSIYWLTLLVMLCGFGFVLYGLFHAFEAPEKLPVAIVASASGVLISFIGGSFLLIYRSILEQSKEYVTVLERINAVGMAVQVISNIPDESAELKHRTTAELAKQLLGLYAARSESQSAGNDQ